MFDERKQVPEPHHRLSLDMTSSEEALLLLISNLATITISNQKLMKQQKFNAFYFSEISN